MKKRLSRIVVAVVVLIMTIASSVYANDTKVKIGFLVHDLVSERWQVELKYFVNKVEELGGETIVKNGLGDASTQVKQGKELIDIGVKVLVIVSQDANILGELVDYADKAGAKVIAYDRMINNCNLHYYVSFNSVKVGELMAQYAIKLKPTGNYLLLQGPSSDNNAILVRKGEMNILKPYIDNGTIKIVYEKELEAWYSLNAMMATDEFLTSYKGSVDAILAASDDLATGAIEAYGNAGKKNIVVTGQDASLEACQNIIKGFQTMTVYKPAKKLSFAAAAMAMSLAKGEKATTINSEVNNGKRNVPSLLYDPIVVDKSNMKQTVIADGHVKVSDF